VRTAGRLSSWDAISESPIWPRSFAQRGSPDSRTAVAFDAIALGTSRATIYRKMWDYAIA
jgi:hypothetical protein